MLCQIGSSLTWIAFVVKDSSKCIDVELTSVTILDFAAGDRQSPFK